MAGGFYGEEEEVVGFKAQRKMLTHYTQKRTVV